MQQERRLLGDGQARSLLARIPSIHIFYAQEPASDRIRFATDPDTLDEFYREEAKTVFDSIIDRCGTLPASVTLDYGVGSPVGRPLFPPATSFRPTWSA